MFFEIVASFLVGTTIWVVFNTMYWKRRNLPPGPMPLPLIGNLHSVAGGPGYDVHRRWVEEYGPVFTVWTANIPQIFVADYDVIMESFVRKDALTLAGRFGIKEITEEMRGGAVAGIIDASGDLWKEQRRFALHVLRNFGFGKNLMQTKVLDEVTIMLQNLDNLPRDKAIDISENVELCVGSIINQLLLGYRFEGERYEEFRHLKEIISTHLRNVTTISTAVSFVFPMLRVIPPVGRAYRGAKDNLNALYNFFETQIKLHKEELDLSSAEEPTDFVEAYLREMHKNEDTETTFTHLQLKNVLLDLWVAGMETTSNTLQFALIFLLNHPEVYDTIKAELRKLDAHDRLLSLDDKPELVYVQAFLNEAQRFANLVPVNLLHAALEDVEIGGYAIPKGTCVVPMISCVMSDPKIFPEPKKFRPERFLDEQGHLRKVDELVPFSIGKRQCLGESLARMELFLIFANLVNKFDLSCEKEGEFPSMTKRMGITVQPEPFAIRIVKAGM